MWHVVDAVATEFGVKRHLLRLGLVAAGGTKPPVSKVTEAIARAEAEPLDISLILGGSAGFDKGAWLVAVVSKPATIVDSGLLLEKLLTLESKLEAVTFSSSHVLTEMSHARVKSGALFKVHEGTATSPPLFCGFFVSPNIALTTNHDSMFTQTLPFSLCATTTAGDCLAFDAIHMDPELDFTVLRCTTQRKSLDHFSLQGCSDLDSGLKIAVVTMSIGSNAAMGTSQQYSVHQASITTFDEQFINYDGAETWGGDSGGALLFEEGYVIGMHLEVVNSHKEFSLEPSAQKVRRRKADYGARISTLEKNAEIASTKSSSHGKSCRALRLTHPNVLAAVETARIESESHSGTVDSSGQKKGKKEVEGVEVY